MINNAFVVTGSYQVPYYTTMYDYKKHKELRLGDKLASGEVVTKTLVSRLKELRNTAAVAVEKGYYTLGDYNKFCVANNLLIF